MVLSIRFRRARASLRRYFTWLTKLGSEGAVVADITTSYIDGSIGELIYSGYAIEDLAENTSFEEILFLLYNSRLPNRTEYEALRSTIAANAAIPDALIQMMKSLPEGTPAMAVLRTAVSMLSAFDPDAENLSDKEVAKAKAFRLTGQITTICAAWMRIAKGPGPDLSPNRSKRCREFCLYDVGR